MAKIVAFLVILATIADNLTTWLCLTHFPHDTWEANPVAAWFFQHLGLEVSLVFNLVVVIIMTKAVHDYYQKNPPRSFPRYFFGFLALSFLASRGLAALSNYLIYLQLLRSSP